MFIKNLAVAVKSEKLDNPNFFQKVAFRFKGIFLFLDIFFIYFLYFLGVPLKGEAHAPKSFFEDCNKEYAVRTPIPSVPRDYKEHPERDLVILVY